MSELGRALPSMTLAIVGTRFPNKDGSNRAFEILLCAPGDPVELRPEPKNKHDERAVAVFSSRNIQLGYLTAERCSRVGALIREGREVTAVFQAKSNSGAWLRVAFDGEVPVLSEGILQEQQRVGGEEEPDFYPDEEWPDD